MGFHHQSVMLSEILSYLQPTEGQIFLDGTLGGGGHSEEILKAIGHTGLLIGIDQDRDALEAAKIRLQTVGSPFRLFQCNYRDFDHCLKELNISQIHGMLLDLGVSSFQLDEGSRGFSYHNEALLDMRMDQSQGLTAETVINTWAESELAEILLSYGEERWAKRIAQFIGDARRDQPVKTTTELVEIIKKAIPKGARQEGPHPARRTFQALRIFVNDELGALQEFLEKGADYLAPGGRIAIISFHSLEDRIVKRSFLEQARDCICPTGFPICQCEQTPRLQVITRKPVLPSKEEIANNPRARSAKLRVAERL